MSLAHTNREAASLALQLPTQWLADICSLGKPRLSSLVIFTAGGAALLAGGEPTAGTLAAAIFGTALVVASANAFNNYIERESDKHMPRTRNRPLPAGRLPPWAALAFGSILLAIALPWMWLATTPLATALALAGWLVYVGLYTPLKRRTWLSVFFGGIAGGLPPLIGWAAVAPDGYVGGVALSVFLLLWQLPHTLAIWLYRKKEYTAAGLKTLPVAKSNATARRHILGYVVALVGASLWLVQLDLGGTLTLIAAVVLGTVFLRKALQGVMQPESTAWARNLFLYSLVYLSGFFAVMAFDRMV